MSETNRVRHGPFQDSIKPRSLLIVEPRSFTFSKYMSSLKISSYYCAQYEIRISLSSPLWMFPSRDEDWLCVCRAIQTPRPGQLFIYTDSISVIRMRKDSSPPTHLWQILFLFIQEHTSETKNEDQDHRNYRLTTRVYLRKPMHEIYFHNLKSYNIGICDATSD